MGVNVTLPEIPGSDSASGPFNGAAFAAFETFSRRFNLVLGYGVLYVRFSHTVAEKTLVFEPTLYGPIFGLGIRLGKIPSS